jgi:hypothetical protein
MAQHKRYRYRDSGNHGILPNTFSFLKAILLLQDCLLKILEHIIRL